jgi:lipid A 3-O-deacylase
MFGRARLLSFAVALGAVLFGAAVPAWAAGPEDAPTGGIFTLVVENDAFARTDRNYTSGVLLSYVRPRDTSDAVRNYFLHHIWPLDGSAVWRTEYTLGQSIFTPRDLSIAAPQPYDRPYAGWLYLGYGLIAERPTTVTTFDLEAGITGQMSGAEWAQRDLHHWLDDKDPQGWPNQLKSHAGVNFTVDRKWRPRQPVSALGIEADFTPEAGATVGNVTDEAFAGLTVRIGSDLETSALPMRVRPSLAGSGSFDDISGIGWYLFAGTMVRAVGYNVFLQGDLPYTNQIEKRPFVLDSQFGIALRLWRLQTTFSYVGRSSEFKPQKSADHFGALGFSWHF